MKPWHLLSGRLLNYFRALLAAAVVLPSLASPGVGAASADSIHVVVPNEFENWEGEGQDYFPFSTTNHQRYQQVHEASQFAAIASSGGWIVAIGFRMDSSYYPPSYIYRANMPSLQVNLSTTAKAPDQLSYVYAENIGADDTVVFGPAPRDMTTSLSTTGWPASLALPLTTPFFYHPRNGNLLLEVFNYLGSREEGGLIDATSKKGDSISTLVGHVGYPEGVIRDTAGLITRFEIVPAPPRPTLAIERSGQATLLRWPTNAAGFVLESTPALQAPTQWAVVTNAPVVAGTNHIVTHGLSSPHQFYRLRYVFEP